MKTKIVIPAAMLFFISGCASIAVRTGDLHRYKAEGIYPGVRADASILSVFWASEASSEARGDRYFWTPIFLVDLPLSAGVDTVCLPYDLLKKKDTEKEPSHQMEADVKTPVESGKAQSNQVYP